MGEPSLQQRLWRGTSVVIYAIRPLFFFLCFPALLMSFGMLLMGGRDPQVLISQSGNFYYALGIGLAMVVLHKQSRKKNSSLWQDATLDLHELAWKRIGFLLGTGVGLAVAFSALITILPLPESWMLSYRSSSEGFREGTDPLLAMISTVCLAPAAEEIVFRGYVLGRLLKGFNERTGILLSAFLFALCHVSFIWMIYAGIMGILLGWVSIREDNTIYAVALHIGFNLSVLPVTLINGKEEWKSLFFGSTVRIVLWGLGAALLAYWAFRRYIQEEIG